MDTLKQIEAYKSRIAVLEGKLFGELSKLPRKFGFSDPAAFIAAVEQACTARPKATEPAKAAGPAKAEKPAKRGKSKRKPRATITEAVRQKVKALVGAKKTSAAIARELDISTPTVQNIKRALGLVKKRG